MAHEIEQQTTILAVNVIDTDGDRARFSAAPGWRPRGNVVGLETNDSRSGETVAVYFTPQDVAAVRAFLKQYDPTEG